MSTHAKKRLSKGEIAAVKLLAYAIQRNVQKVAARYPAHANLSVFRQMHELTEVLVSNAERGEEIAIVVSWQPPLPNFEETDESYAEFE